MTKGANRNRFCFGLGTLGRDAVYTLVSMYLITYLTETVGLSNAELGIIGGIMVAFRIFDALNDPIMGTIVDNTSTKWGKFKPWILFGVIAAGILTVLLFTDFGLSGVGYIVFFSIVYLLWGMAYTTNDISYWSLMPAITKDQKQRENIGAFARICANVGMFAVVILYTMVPDLFGMAPKQAYFIFALLLVAIMIGFQMFTVFGVKEERVQTDSKEHTSLGGMIKALMKNDQLMVAAVAMALFMIGYCTTTSFGVYYFKYAYKDEGTYMVFAAVLGVAQLTALSVFPLFSKKFTRKQLYFGSMIAVVASYLIFFLSFENLALIVISGLVLFFAQAFIQLLMLLFLADAVEYGEWKLGRRNESVSFAVQPFINKLGGAIGTLVVTVTLIISGINPVSQKVAELEELKAAATDPAVSASIQAQIDALIGGVEGSPIWIMKIAMMILPLICILVGFIIYYKKFKIDEKMYERIVSDLAARDESASCDAEIVSVGASDPASEGTEA
ncbi:MAG: MFS transporter [Clostridia bacterium]|nr:MFS transporter [Clostridia bacterium]